MVLLIVDLHMSVFCCAGMSKWICTYVQDMRSIVCALFLCMYSCIHTYKFVRMCVCVCVCGWVDGWVGVHVCIMCCACTRTYVHTYVCNSCILPWCATSAIKC